MVSVIRADDDVVLANVSEQVGYVLVCFGSDVDTAVAEEARAEIAGGELVTPRHATTQEMKQERNPRCVCLDEAEAQVWEPLGNLIVNQIVEGDQWQQANVREVRHVVVVAHLRERCRACPRVNANRQVQT